ncbi:uncharacterized protein [Mytilus edulis]|uniref:uncharacterized protein n=1 Tax=Mytilus edulis TaxID=6550 RepID=UPI0039F11E14
MDSTHHTQPNAYEDMGPKFKVKQSLKKTTEENVKDSNINIYESMKEQACGNTPTEDPLRDIKLKNPAENKTVLYESMKMSAQDNTQTSDIGREIKVENSSESNDQHAETVKKSLQDTNATTENKIVDMYTSFKNINTK